MKMSQDGQRILLPSFSVLTSFFALWNVAASDQVFHESVFRFALGGWALFFAPGLALLPLLRMRLHTLLERLPASFLLSVGMSLPIIVLAYVLNFTMIGFCFIFLASSILLQSISFFRSPSIPVRPHELISTKRSTTRRWHRSIAQTVTGFAILVLTAVTYRHGEDLFDLGNEKGLHLMYLRQYFSLPLDIHVLGIQRGLTPANLVNLWEFLLAAWSRFAGLDPLVLFFRARALIPLVALSGIYWLLCRLLVSRHRAALATTVVSALALVQYALVSPSPLDWVKQDATRGIFCFRGSVHHADSAMGILLPLASAVCLGAIQNRRTVWKVLAFLIALVMFLWHPREFFQIALYVGIGSIFFLLTREWKGVKATLKILGLFVCAALLFLSLRMHFTQQEAHVYDEGKIKTTAALAAVRPEHLLGFRNPFDLPFHIMLALANNPDHIANEQQILDTFQSGAGAYLWLLLAALSGLYLMVSGTKPEKRTTAYFFLSWYLMLCWNAAVLAVIVLTYNEFYMSTPRLLHTGAYIVTALGGLRLAETIWQRSPAKRIALSVALVASAGMIGYSWQTWPDLFRRNLHFFGWALLVAVFTTLIWNRRIARYCQQPSTGRGVTGALLLAVLAIAAATGTNNLAECYSNITFSRTAPKWTSDNNPFGFSASLVKWLREQQDGQSILVRPIMHDETSSRHWFFAYTAAFTSVFPCRSVMAHLERAQEIRDGRCPFFVGSETFSSPDQKTGLVTAAEFARHLPTDLVILFGEDYSWVKGMEPETAGGLSVEYENPVAREIVLRVLTTTGQNHDRGIQ